MRRLTMLAAAAIVAALLATGVALAQPSGQGSPTPVDETPIDLPAGAVFGNCDFPISLEYSGKAKTIELPGDRFIITSPGLKVTLTNLADPENPVQVRLNITGAFHRTILENGDVVTVVTGRNLLGDPEAGFVLAKGRFSYVFDADGNLIQPLSGKGTLTDVCTLIA